MSAVTLLFLVLSALSVFVVAAVVIGREAHRLDGVQCKWTKRLVMKEMALWYQPTLA